MNEDMVACSGSMDDRSCYLDRIKMVRIFLVYIYLSLYQNLSLACLVVSRNCIVEYFFTDRDSVLTRN